jgi:predicted membrane protein|tara:strand:+ start:1157 stop:1546 length:390 start_codon:yes stop_codon:yes gene_type:complete
MNSNNIKVSSNKNFGVIFFIFFLLVSLWPLLNNGEMRFWSLIVSLLFLLLAIIKPYLLTPLNKVWTRFGFFLGAFIAPIIMGLVFFVIVTPTGFLMRIFSKDYLNLKKNDNKSYWINSSDKKSKMKNQF